MTFFDRVEKELQNKKMTIGSLSSATGIPYQSIRNLKVRGNTPKLETVEKIARCLDVTVGYLLYGNLEVKPPPTEISDLEKQIIDDFRKLDRRDQQEIIELLEVKKRHYLTLYEMESRKNGNG